MRQKAYSLITISGMAIGLGIFMLFALVSDTGFNIGKLHKNAKRIYGIVQVFSSGNEGERHSAITPAPLIPAMKSEFPEIEDATRSFPADQLTVKCKDEIIYENSVLFADPNFISFFSFDMVSGDPETALSKPYSIVLTEAAALKYFGDINPIGKILTINNKLDMTVTGVTKEIPLTSAIRFDFLISFETARYMYNWMNDWKAYNQSSFLLLPENSNPDEIDLKLQSFIDKYYAHTPDSPTRMYLFPFKDFFFKSRHIDSYMSQGFIAVFVLLLIIGVVFLIVVSFNYMNLSTARSITRAKEIGLRKVVGAHRINLIMQFLGESVIFSLLSLPVALVIYKLLSDFFIPRLGADFEISIWNNQHLWFVYFGVTVLVGVFSGSYPAFFLSAFKPVMIIKGLKLSGKKGPSFRKVLIVTQFAFSVILIVFSIVVRKQFDHIINVDFGYNRTGVIAVQIGEEARSQIEPMKKELIKHSEIIAVSTSGSIPAYWDTKLKVIPEGIDENDAWSMNVYGIDYDFIKVFDMKIVQGRDFSREYEDKDKFIINEKAMEQLQWQNPVGKQITVNNRKGFVIGVVKDYHFKDVHYPLLPAVFSLSPEYSNYLLVRASSQAVIPDVVKYMKEQWYRFLPAMPFEYIIHENYFFDNYRAIQTIAELCGAVAICAIIFSCLGLFGLASFAVERRIKEIGIRKVLGASVAGIVSMLIKDFLLLVIIANSIALPIAYFISYSFLQWGFTFRISVGSGILLFTVAVTFITALIAVTSQTLKAAFANPVDSLKYE